MKKTQGKRLRMLTDDERLLIARYEKWSDLEYCAGFVTPNTRSVETFIKDLKHIPEVPPPRRSKDYELEFLEEYKRQTEVVKSKVKTWKDCELEFLEEHKIGTKKFEIKVKIWDDFVKKYKPIKNPHLAGPSRCHPFNGHMFETGGSITLTPEFEQVKKTNPKYVWTLVACEGKEYIFPNFHFVNRLGYFITSRPWEDKGEEFLA
jgi:hypothetical protein